MKKYKIILFNENTRTIEEDLVDDMVFDSEDEAQDYACEYNSSASLGREISYMSNPGDSEDYEDDGSRYIVVEVDD